MAKLFLGAEIDAQGQRTNQTLHLKADDLTTHGVILGMTGSGKTGLGVVLIEEALRANIPVLVIDPKGDMGNLALAFDDPSEKSFGPWLAADSDTDASQMAQRWSEGLKDWGFDAQTRKAYAQSIDIQVYTPGNAKGRPLNILGRLAPPVDEQTDPADEINGLVSGILALLGKHADPLRDREHILLSAIILRLWENQEAPSIADLIYAVQKPPIDRLGVFDIETFFPAADRQAFALELNTLLASPTFKAWTQGDPLDLDQWLTPGKARATVLSLQHLSEDERQFVVSTVMSKVVTWMRTQPGSDSLRALVYMDEVFGFLPPVANPPTKIPMLTILKQARAHGLGMVLATQNPIDLDYKSLSNAGTWMLGRLQTDRDRERLLAGVNRGQAQADFKEALASLSKRQFVLVSAKQSNPTKFTSRWALSYLRGPMTPVEIKKLAPAGATTTEAPSPNPAPSSTSSTRPPLSDGLEERWLAPQATWGPNIGAMYTGRTFVPALVLQYALRFDERKGNIDAAIEWERVYPGWTRQTKPSEGEDIDFQSSDFLTQAPEGVDYLAGQSPLNDKKWLGQFLKSVKTDIYQRERLELQYNPTLKIYGRPEEGEAAFAARCDTAAQKRADEQAAKLRDKYQTKLDRKVDQAETAERRLEELEADLGSQKRYELLAGVGSILGMFLGGKRSTRSIASKAGSRIGSIARRRSSTARKAEKVETAELKIESLEEDIESLQAELEEELIEIDEQWKTKAEDIQTMTIALEQNDIRQEQVFVVWYPISNG